MSTVAAITAEDLLTLDLFQDLDEAELGAWLAVAEALAPRAGEALNQRGTESPGLHLLLEGEVRTIVFDEDGRPEPMGRQFAPTWMGAVASLTGSGAPVQFRAMTDCRMALIPREDFKRLVFDQKPVFERIMRVIAPVASRMTQVGTERERLASLGVMAAGLAHELNNPTAAARRVATHMTEAIETISSSLASFVDAGVERDQAHGLVELHRAALARAEGRTALDALDAADAEDELTERLEDHGIADPWELAEPLAAAGLDAAWLDEVVALAGPATAPALRWVAASLNARTLVGELEEATKRMTDLVGAVKSYAYLDRGGRFEVDVHEGLESTIVVLGHKLKQTNIEIVRDYDRTLPPIRLLGSEMNQVWTNLLDNAIDALGDSGTITIRTRPFGEGLTVRITDDGPGIPADVKAKVFDSFFTTKDVGQGTGLGLSTAYRIVTEAHDGAIGVETGDGWTCFETWLPYRTPDDQ